MISTLRIILIKTRHYYSALGVRGVLLFYYSKISGRKPIISVSTPGVAHPIRLRIGTTDISTYMQVLVERQYDFDIPITPRFAIDAGANIGLASIYFSNKYPLARIVAIEPEESNYLMLCLNIAPYPNIRAVRAALWFETNNIKLFDSGFGNHGFQVSSNDVATCNFLDSVPGITVEMILKQSGETIVDLLKVDIEGAERNVMEKSEYWISRVKVIMIELHDHISQGCSEAFYNATQGFSPVSYRGETLMRHSINSARILPHD